MRSLGAVNPLEFGPIAPDAVHNFVLAAATAGAADFTSVGSTAQVRFMEIMSNVAGYVRIGSTGVSAPASNMTSGSSGMHQFAAGQPWRYQVPGGSTGYSLITPSSCLVSVALWQF